MARPRPIPPYRRVGVLSARSYRHLPWTQQDVRMLTLVASIVAPALEAASSAARVSQVRLTPKETQVLSDMMAGRSAKSIARASGLAEATVRTHIRSVLAKFGVNSQLAAVVLARDLGFESAADRLDVDPNDSSVLGIRATSDLA